jgi:ribosome-associated heat shock protein Hsp15
MNGQTVKPSRMIKEGDILTLARTRFTMTIRIQALPQQRVGAPLVSQYLEDLTPPDEYQKQEQVQELDFEIRDQGTGRPTKRNRREIERLKRLLGA